MVFSSLSFLTLFLPLTILLYFAVPRRFRNLLLFLASLIFYAWGEPVYIVLMLFSSVVDYSHGLLMEKFDGRPGVRRALLISSVAINLSLLGFFKYAGRVVSTLNAALSLSIGIALQNFPEGAIISMPLKAAGNSKARAFGYGVFSGVVEPVAALITVLFSSVILPVLPYLLSFAAGAMIYVVVEELIPESQSGEHSNIATVGVMLGFVVMMIMDMALG